MISKSKEDPDSLWSIVPMLLASLDTARALSLQIAIRSGNLQAFLDVLDLPMHFGPFSIGRMQREYESYMLLRKVKNLPFSTDEYRPDLRAIDAFIKAEDSCRSVNHRLASYAHEGPGRKPDLELRMVRNLASVLGQAPSPREVVRNGGWGPGATFALPRASASPELKTINESGITLDALKYLHRSWDEVEDLLPLPLRFTLTPGSRISTVPKSVKTDRTIAIEPGWNSFLQKGVGKTIRRRLLRRGIDLDRGADIHRAFCESTPCHEYATIDLSAASDSLSTVLLGLLPQSWFDLLTDLRSSRYLLDKEWFEFEKISSMGNGFTFEFESAFFFAVCLSSHVPADRILIFGDDIIVPRQYAESVIDNLSYFGFKTNTDKTFVDGSFRESCGVHVYNGIDLKPFQVKEVRNGHQAITLANQIRWFSRDLCGRDRCDRRYLASWRACLDRIPTQLRSCRGPLGLSGVLWCNLSEIKGLTYHNSVFGITTAKGFRIGIPAATYANRKRRSSTERLLLHRLWDLVQEVSPGHQWLTENQQGTGNTVKVTRNDDIRVIRLIVSQRWLEPGPWGSAR